MPAFAPYYESLVGESSKGSAPISTPPPLAHKIALRWLEKVQSAARRPAASGIPLRHQINEKKFKILFLDVGLLQTANEVDSDLIWTEKITTVHAGAIAEQFVGQELLSYSGVYEDRRIYFWERETAGSSAEVDYVINIRSQIVPIEVKAGKTGRLRSLKSFLERRQLPVGIKISQDPLALNQNVLSVPLYLIEQIPRLLEQVTAL